MSHDAPPPGYGYPYPVAPPAHSSATTAMVLGIVAVAGGFLCWLPLLLAPFAWFTGAKAVKEIDASQGMQSGRGEATAGKVLGIIGTALLALAVVAVTTFIVLSLTVHGFAEWFWDEDPGSSGSFDAVSGWLR